MSGEAAFTEDAVAQLEVQTRGALRSVLEVESLPDEVDEVVTGFFADHQWLLADSTTAFASVMLRTATGEPQRSEEVEAALKGLTAEQLTRIAESDATDAEAAAVIRDARRELLDGLAGAGMTTFRFALATGLQLVLPGSVGPLGFWSGDDRRTGPSDGTPAPGGVERRRALPGQDGRGPDDRPVGEDSEPDEREETDDPAAEDAAASETDPERTS